MKITFDPEKRPGGLQNFCSYNRFNDVLKLHGIQDLVKDYKSFDWHSHEAFIKDACALKDWEELVGIHLSNDGINIIIAHQK